MRWSFAPWFRRLSVALIAATASAFPLAAVAEPAVKPAHITIFASADMDGLPFDDMVSVSEEVVEWIDEPADEALVSDEDEGGATSRFIPSAGTTDASFRPSRTPIAAAGPFYLVTPDTIEMIGTVDRASPRQFAGLIASHPGVRRLVMIECPGSIDEDANHALARQVRRAGIDTLVPRGGSVRSGAVDLFLAGVHRRADPTAEFGVHSWRDSNGREAADFAANDPVNAEYLAYYRDMGLSADQAQRFYALTNSVPFEDVRYLSAVDMARMGLAELDG